MEKLVYDASVQGNLTILLKVLQQDPLILDKTTLNPSDDTPLHVASMLGHTDFVKEILTRRPQLAVECDLQRRLPLHLAAAKGHVDIVRALVSAHPETCLACDRDGRNPLHLSAVKGRCEVVKVLLQAQPHAARAMVQQETILHMCVKHNQVEVLKLLVEVVGDHEFLNSKDADGNSILHLAVADKQIETINFLLLNTTIEVDASDTWMDILGQGPKDPKDQRIIRSLTRAGAKTEGLSLDQHPKSKAKYDDKDDWLDKKRNTLMVVASLIATMAFQAGTNPPSGVWQEDSTTDPSRKAGFAVMVYNHPNLYHVFLVCNTVGFVSTLSIILLLISGLPFLRHRVFVWLLMVIMWMATASMSLTYLVSITALTPKPEAGTFRLVANGIVVVWIGLMTLLVAGHTIRLMKVAKNLTKLTFPKKKKLIVLNHDQI